MTANTVSSAVATREAGPVSLMWKRGPHFAAVLPDHIDVKAFLGTAAGALYADDDLMKAAQQHPDSLITTLMRCAALGHQPGTDEFYLHIRKGKVDGTEGYRGVIERMYRSGAVAKVVVREVCAGDPFSFTEGLDDRPVHEIGGRGTTGADFFGAAGSRNRGAMVGVYAYARFVTGDYSRVVIMDRDDVMAARESYDAKDSKYSPWNRLDGGKDHPELTGRSMWWKTAAKRLEPWVPTSAEYRREMLRASAAASDLPGSRAPGNGAAAVYAPPDTEILDAEIVGETAVPAAGPDAAVAAPAQASRPTGAMLGKLGKLLKQVPLGTPDDDAAYLGWHAGRPVTLTDISRDECASAIRALEQSLEDAGGNADEAASLIWGWYRAAHEAGQQPEAGDE